MGASSASLPTTIPMAGANGMEKLALTPALSSRLRWNFGGQAGGGRIMIRLSRRPATILFNCVACRTLSLTHPFMGVGDARRSREPFSTRILHWKKVDFLELRAASGSKLCKSDFLLRCIRTGNFVHHSTLKVRSNAKSGFQRFLTFRQRLLPGLKPLKTVLIASSNWPHPHEWEC